MKMRFIILFFVCLTSGILCTPFFIDKVDDNSLEDSVLKREDKRCSPAIRRRDIDLCLATCGPDKVCRKRQCIGGECCSTVTECVACRKHVVCIALAGCVVITDEYGCQFCFCSPPIFDLLAPADNSS